MRWDHEFMGWDHEFNWHWLLFGGTGYGFGTDSIVEGIVFGISGFAVLYLFDAVKIAIQATRKQKGRAA